MEKAVGIGSVAMILLFIAAVVGWVMNIVKLIGFSGGQFAGNEIEIILRAVGIFAAPIGAVMGWF